jgi:integrase
MKLTVDTVAKLSVPEGKSELIVFDDALPGFGVRLRIGGSKTWIVQYQIGTKQRRASLGRVAGLAPDKARLAAGKLLAKVKLGEDPQAEKFEVRATAALTTGVVVERFLARQRERLRPRTLIEVERHLKTYWKPLHRVQIGAVDRSMIAGQITKLLAENGSTVADHARTSLSTLFTWAMKEGLVDTNPVAATNRPSEPVSRDRVLSDAELREIWAACRDDDYGRIIKLLLLTGQRREEISALRWSEVDRGEALISLPKERTKNHRAHNVPLSDAALAALPLPARPRPGLRGRPGGFHRLFKGEAETG